MRIFITGGSGFIGKALLPLLTHHEILCLTHKDQPEPKNHMLRTIVGDLGIPASYCDELECFKPECCVHLAWNGLPDYSFQNCQANLAASAALFDILCRSACGRIVAGGSCWEYGANTGAVKEAEQGGDLNLFAAHKTALQLIGQSIYAGSGSSLAWGRIFFSYGPSQRPGSLIPSCFSSLKNGAAPRINNPLAVNDFIHVADVAEAIRRLIEGDAVGIYNIGSGQPTAVWEVVNLLADELGLPQVYHDMPPSIGGFWADTTKMNTLGWQPRFSLQAGIAQTVSALEAAQ